MNLKWSKIKSQSSSGGERDSPTLNYISSINAILLFGGLTSPTQNEIYLYHISSHLWKIQPTEGRKPTPRKYHTSYYHSKYLDGSWWGKLKEQKSGRLVRTIHQQLEMEKNLPASYTTTKAATLPQSSQQLQLELEKQLIIFGGISIPYKTYFNDLWLLKNINPLKLNSSNQIYGPECVQITTKGQPPSPRHSHNSYLLKDNLFIFGGQSQTIQNELTCFILNIPKKIWDKINFSNSHIPQISKLSIAPIKQDQILLFGGSIVQTKQSNKKIFKININQLNIKKIEVQNYPTTLNKLTTCYVDTKDQPQIYSIGWDKNNIEFVKLQGFSKETHQIIDIPLEQYLISIKNQQILSQQLIKKNNYLEQLYLIIQKYISQLHHDYLSVDDYNQKVQSEKQKHIGYSLQLKENYAKIEELYRDTIHNIYKARSQLSAINQQFDKCIETQLDQDQ